MNRRTFLKGLAATAAGLLVPAEIAAEPERRVWAFPRNPLTVRPVRYEALVERQLSAGSHGLYYYESANRAIVDAEPGDIVYLGSGEIVLDGTAKLPPGVSLIGNRDAPTSIRYVGTPAPEPVAFSWADRIAEVWAESEPDRPDYLPRHLVAAVF